MIWTNIQPFETGSGTISTRSRNKTVSSTIFFTKVHFPMLMFPSMQKVILLSVVDVTKGISLSSFGSPHQNCLSRMMLWSPHDSYEWFQEKLAKTEPSSQQTHKPAATIQGKKFKTKQNENSLVKRHIQPNTCLPEQSKNTNQSQDI